MMLRASPLCSSSSISYPPIPLSYPYSFLPVFSFEPFRSATAASSRARFRFNLVENGRNLNFLTGRTAIHEAVESSSSESELVEVGYLSSVHGLQGEICIKPSTDFPHLRFSKPGRRWLRQQFMGREKIQEVELVEGRPHHGQKSWILKFRGIDTVEEVKQLVGSTLLAEEDDRPELEEGEFYTRDLVGVRVLLKETGQLVGTVSKVFDSGGYDLLHVMLDSSMDVSSERENGCLVWIPFVKAIVPDVDLERREMFITPPKGLLELNMRADDRSKKERRQLEWKERKKHQKRLIAAKKKLSELGQQHVFEGLRFGEKPQRRLLADHIIAVNFKLLQQALQSIETPTETWNTTAQINALKARLPEGTLTISREQFNPHAGKEKEGESFDLLQQGKNLISEGKVSVCLVLSSGNDVTDPVLYLNKLLLDEGWLLKEEDREGVPLVLICPEHAIEALQKLFQDNDHFGFESEKIYFLEEEKLPVVCSSPEPEEPIKHKIAMKSPWEILESPVGSGGVINMLASHGITDTLSTLGIEYLQVRSIDGSTKEAHCINPMLTGFVCARGAELGIQVAGDSEIAEERFEMTMSMKFLKRAKGKVQFKAIPAANSYVQRVEKEWIESVVSEPNSFEFRSSIYRVLEDCSSSCKICLIDVRE